MLDPEAMVGRLANVQQIEMSKRLLAHIQ